VKITIITLFFGGRRGWGEAMIIILCGNLYQSKKNTIN
jgi:hypothetical protein